MTTGPTGLRRKGRYKNCEACGAEFYCAPAKVSQRWCSRGCVPREKRHLGPQHQSKGRTLLCAHCGQEFPVRPSAIENGRKFCSRDCLFASGVTQSAEAREKRQAASRDRVGQKNPNYRNGRSAGRQIRGFTLKLKGEGCCRNCGGLGEGVHALHLHHVIPRSLCRETRDKILNGVPLCPSCHHGWHRRSLTIYRDIFTADEWTFLSSVKLTGQNIAAWLDDHYPPRPTCGTAAETFPGTVVSSTLQPSREVPQ